MAHSVAIGLSAMANRSAGRLCRRYPNSGMEQVDVSQELLVDLLGRLGSYDERRGPWRPFVLLCFQHRAARFLSAIQREYLNRYPADLDAPAPDQPGVALIDTLTIEDGIGFWLGQNADPVAQSDLHHDLDRALGTLDSDAVLFCVTLLRDGRGGREGCSRATVHRRVRDLRCQLLAAGIGPRETSLRTRGY